jgi:ABC-type antimicrobial peptide transport system permease subunit
VGIPLVRGRNFDSSDRPGERGAIIINQVMADRFWPGEDPLGRTIHEEDGEELVVVGVARSATVRSLGESPRPFIYRSFGQYYSTLPSVVIRARTTGEARSLVPQVMETIRGVDPGVVFVDTKTMEEHLAVSLLPARLGALFSAVFAAVALVLASIGLYGVVSYAVASRSREMGIRMSLGADTRGVVAMMVRGGMRLVMIGGGIGMVLAIGASTVLQSLLYGVKVLDPVTFLGVPAVLLGVALLAAWVPARRASRVDPAEVLKGR